MATKVAINGFGRIGRMSLRAMIAQSTLGEELEVVAINDLVPAEHLAYLLKHDSLQGNMNNEVKAEKDAIVVADQRIPIINEKKSPAELPWDQYQPDIVIESTGLFTDGKLAAGHIEAGAKKVIISAPCKSDNLTVVMGVNNEKYDPGKHHVVSNASCTTNCLAPVVHVLLESGIGLAEGLMTTIHSYTSSQNLVDGPNKKNYRLGRAAAQNIVPTTTGAAKAVGLAIPEVEGKLTGMALRVPTATGSVVDLTFRSERASSLDEINSEMKKAGRSYLQGILDYSEEELVSTDLIHNPFSAVYDSKASMELNDGFFKLIAWYDNEWGYSNRIVHLAKFIASRGF